MKKFLSSLVLTMVLLLGSGIICNAQTTLAAGDIAFIGINSDGSDDFVFVLLKNIESGTVLYITDKGWDDASSNFFSVAGDETLTWTATSNMPAGSIIQITTAQSDGTVLDPDVASVGSLSGNTIIGAIGDQVFIYQGSASSPTFITGIHFNVETGSTNGNWDGSVGSTTTSCLPDQLTNGVNAIWVYGTGPIEYDNFRYKCSTTSGTPAELSAAINNLSNWDVDLSNATPYTLNPFPCSFTVNTACIEPAIPTVTASPSSIIAGGSSTLTITGTINDATSWHVYTGSCGGTSIGSTVTTSFIVSPTTTTTYFIRGEGGCATPGSCGTVTVTVVPAISSATYNANTGTLTVSGTSFEAKAGAANDISVSKLTITGEGGYTYTLTSSDVEIASSTQFSVTLNGTDLAAVNQIVNKNGTSSTGGTTYNLAAADDWCANVTAGNISDVTNALTASNVTIPTITSATYNANTENLIVTGTGFLKLAGATNDIVTNKLTITGEGGTTHTLTSTSVEITSGTSFTVTLNGTDKAAVNQIVNKNGTSSTGGTTYKLAADEDWAAGADPAVAVADITGNGIIVSNVAAPTITSATYNANTGNLIVTGTGFLSLSGTLNDVVTNKLTITGEGGTTYTLTSTSVEITSGTSFTVTLNGTDKAAVNLIVNKNGTSSTGGTTYNLAAAEDWAAGADPAVAVADITGNEITVSGLILPTVTTQAVSSITTTTATGNGNLTNLGVPNPTAHGVCWNTTGTPTVLDSKVDNGAASATGAFTASITGLTEGTTYYVRVFATNTSGTSYGDEVSFTTQSTPTITWDNPSDIVYGTLLSTTQLNATASVSGTFTYTPDFGTRLNVGSTQNLKVDFTPTNAVLYLNTSKTVTINVTKATPVIIWNNPADISNETALSITQLNATADVPGVFTYTPAIGTKLNVGNAQSLKADFEPTDAENYMNTSKTVLINVFLSTGISEVGTNKVVVFPNPAVDAFSVYGIEGRAKISLTDLNGKVILTNEITAGEKVFLTNLPSGIYIIKLELAGDTILRKIVKK